MYECKIYIFKMLNDFKIQDNYWGKWKENKKRIFHSTNILWVDETFFMWEKWYNHYKAHIFVSKEVIFVK